MLTYSITTQTIVFRRLQSGKVIYLRIGVLPDGNGYSIKPCDPPLDELAISEVAYIEQMSTTDPIHVKEVIQSFNNYPQTTSMLKKRKKRKETK